jgi:hypothetical protein
VAYKKKSESRAKKGYTGPWTIYFKCEKLVFVSWAGSMDIKDIAMKLHEQTNCKLPGCHIVKYQQER